MARTVFVSFVFEDKPHFEMVQRWAADRTLGTDVVVIGETRDVRQDGEAAIRNHLKPRIEASSSVLLLLGSDTHNHEWVRYELSVATTFKKKLVVARIPGTRGAAPVGFQHLKEIALDPGALRDALA